ncbi:MAG: hypothetical protein M0R22_10390 [Dehalococcoidia bacterium]|nr:hypothetical protein [Dehalococcoidia bacterium]
MLRLPAFLGCLLLLYAMATGLSSQGSAGASGMPAASQHGIAGIVGTVLCIVGIILISRRRSP